MMKVRLTKDVIGKILNQNEGVKKSTSYESKNSSYSNHYLISGGKLLLRSVGKTSWADSRYDNNSECDIDQTRRFIRKFMNSLNMDNLD